MMNRNSVLKKLEAEIDVLADIEHSRWAHWQRYMHGKSECLEDGSLVIPAELVRQWERQIETPYWELSEKEKESDREQVRRYISSVADLVSSK